MEIIQQEVEKLPIHCSFCKSKTKNISGSGVLKQSKTGLYSSSCGCTVCKRRKARRVGKSIIDSWLKEWNNRSPEAVRELHLIQQPDKCPSYKCAPKKSSFCGPGTNLSKRLKNLNRATGEYDSVITPPINKLDAECLNHDVAYTVHKDKKGRQPADKALIKVADAVRNDRSEPSLNRLNASLVAKLFRKKLANDW